MAEIQTSLTRRGFEVLCEGGLLNAIKYYSIGDAEQLYNVTATNNIIPAKTGFHGQLAEVFCGKAQYNGIFPSTPTESETITTRSRLELQFNKVNCDDQFTTSNLQLQVNINTWLNELNSAVYDFNMVESLSQTLWNFVSVNLQTLDLTTKDYKTVKQLTNFKVTYSPATEVDLRNYTLISPKYTTVINGKEKRLVNKAEQRYASPFIYTLSTENVGGNIINGTTGIISLVPGNWGYWANNTFLDLETVENSDPNTWDTIYPAVQIGSSYYYLNNNTGWNTSSGLIGYLMNMVNVDGSGVTALKSLTDQSLLFFKTNGKLMTDGSYQIPVTFNVNVASRELNNINDIIGNRVTVIFSYNPSDTTSDIIQLIS